MVPFICVGGAILVVAILMFILYSIGIMKKLTNQRDNQQLKTYEEKSFSEVWLFFTVVIIFYFSLVSGENMFFANIYSFAHCSYLKISSSAATYLNSTFWAGFGIGRFLGIFFSKFLTATQYIIIDVIGILISTILLDLFTESNLILWGSVFCYGLFVASLYSCQSSEFKKNSKSTLN